MIKRLCAVASPAANCAIRVLRVKLMTESIPWAGN